MKSIKMGGPEDFRNFFCAVIDEIAFNKITAYIDHAKESEDAEIIAGGNYSCCSFSVICLLLFTHSTALPVTSRSAVGVKGFGT